MVICIDLCEKNGCEEYKCRYNDLTDRFRAEEEKLRHAAVDKVTVYHNDRLVYSLKDGTEITVEL